MLDEKQKQLTRKVISGLIAQRKIVKPERGRSYFFLEKSKDSFLLAKRILEIADDPTEQLKSYAWVVCIAYYSMFFAATALLAHFMHKIDGEQGIHKLTSHALLYYFILDDNKLQKHFIEEYQDTYKEAEQLLQLSEQKALEMVQDFDFEQQKRKIFTYEMGKIAEQQKARTSLQRAENFLMEVRKIIEA